MLKESFPHMEGLQPTILEETLGFSIAMGDFVQVLHVSNSHWLTVANIGYPKGHVNVYDSIPSGDIPGRTKMQIAAILCTEEQNITVHFPVVQSQKGGSDCGLFALAFAATLCVGENPAQVNYIQHKLRNHLFDCLENRTIRNFPQLQRKKKAHLLGHSIIPVFCSCRQPASGTMICCSTCHEWYHKDCVSAPAAAWKKTSYLWSCPMCVLVDA